MNKQVIVVGQNGSVEGKELPADGLEFLQNAVGGWVQAVDLSGAFEGITLWVNEEGKFDSSLTFNELATGIWEQSFGANTDYIMGNAVFTGGADDEGETLGLTYEQIAWLYSAFLLVKAMSEVE
jgi:hypothetical protein